MFREHKPSDLLAPVVDCTLRSTLRKMPILDGVLRMGCCGLV